MLLLVHARESSTLLVTAGDPLPLKEEAWPLALRRLQELSLTPFPRLSALPPKLVPMVRLLLKHPNTLNKPDIAGGIPSGQVVLLLSQRFLRDAELWV